MAVASYELLIGLPEPIAIDILLRLPLKYLCRCKCLSKTWCSIISTEIMTLHHLHNIGIVIIDSTRNHFLQTTVTLGSNNTNTPPPFITHRLGEYKTNLPNEYSEHEIKFTQIINGLFCYYGSDGVFLCNSYTFETMKLPLPLYYLPEYNPQFYLGFDPLSGSYKLLCLGGRVRVIFHEILDINMKMTMEIGYWKQLCHLDVDEGIGIDVLCTPSVCINGYLYWWLKCPKNKRRILAFNLGIPCFHTISLPSTLVCADFCQLTDLSTSARMVKFEGNLAVACLAYDGSHPKERERLNIWEVGGNCPGWCNGSRCWIQHSPITLPEELVRCNRESWCSVGNFPTGEILFANPKANASDSFTAIYSYEHFTGKFQRFVVGKFPPCMVASESSFQISCLELNSRNHSFEALLRQHPTAAVVDCSLRKRSLACLTLDEYTLRPKKQKSFQEQLEEYMSII